MATTREPLIHLENLSRVFTTAEVETHALVGVSLDIERNDYLAVSGPSGCGKSTLLSIIGLLDTPTAGSTVSRANQSSSSTRHGERSSATARSGTSSRAST